MQQVNIYPERKDKIVRACVRVLAWDIRMCEETLNSVLLNSFRARLGQGRKAKENGDT